MYLNEVMKEMHLLGVKRSLKSLFKNEKTAVDKKWSISVYATKNWKNCDEAPFVESVIQTPILEKKILGPKNLLFKFWTRIIKTTNFQMMFLIHFWRKWRYS